MKKLLFKSAAMLAVCLLAGFQGSTVHAQVEGVGEFLFPEGTMGVNDSTPSCAIEAREDKSVNTIIGLNFRQYDPWGNSGPADPFLRVIHGEYLGFPDYFSQQALVIEHPVGVYGRVEIGDNQDSPSGVGVRGDGGNIGVLGLSNTPDFYAEGVHGEGVTGVYGIGTLNTPFQTTGVLGDANNDFATPYGVLGNAGSNGPGIICYGVAGNAFPGQSSIAYGVYGQAPVNPAGGPASNYAVYANGNTFQSSGAGPWTSSDARLKKNIEPIENALEIIRKLEPVTYDYRYDDKRFEGFNLATERQFGFIAQDVAKVLPNITRDMVAPRKVYNEETGKLEDLGTIEIKAMQYAALIPVLTEGMKEQQSMIDDVVAENQRLQVENDRLKAQMEAIDARLAKLDEMEAKLSRFGSDLQSCCLSQSGKGAAGAAAQDSKLEQNSPNPFDKNTSIQYYVPDAASSAQLQITSLDGKVLDTIELEANGYGTTMLRANTYAAGTYLYTLVVDGVQVATKQMVLTK